LKPLGVGIIGCGVAGGLHANSYDTVAQQGKVKLVAACDVNENAAKTMATEYKMDAHYTDWRDLIKRKDINAVSICLPHYLHADVTVAAARAGKHVLCEKPMAITLKDCDRMIKAAKEANVKLMIAESVLFLPAFMKAKELVAEGMIGEVYFARAYEGVNEIPRTSVPEHWHDTPDKAGGGVLMDMAVHFNALLRWILGEVEHVRACWTDKLVVKVENKAEDNAIMLAKFKNGAMAEIVVSNTLISPAFNRLELYGTEGTIFEDHSLEKPVKVFSTKPGPKSFDWCEPEVEHEPYPGYYVISFRNEVQHFVDCILEDKKPKMSGEDGKAAVEMVHMGYMAEKTGKIIGRSDLYSDTARKLGIK